MKLRYFLQCVVTFLRRPEDLLKASVSAGVPAARNFIKEDSAAQVFFYEFFEIFKNIFFKEQLRATATSDEFLH